MSTRPKTVPPEENESATDWEALDSRVSTAVHEIQEALQEALAAARDLAEWVERLHTLSTFMRQVESGLVEVRQQMNETSPPAGPAPVPMVAPKAEEPSSAEPAHAEAEESVEPPTAAEAERTAEAAEGEAPDKAPSAAEAGRGVNLEIVSSGANIDLMVVERALRETPGVADVDLLDYAGKHASVQVTLSEGERPAETGSPERLAAHIQERLAELAWDGSLSVSVAE